MLFLLAGVARPALTREGSCSVCYHTVSHFDLLCAQNAGRRLSPSLARTSCRTFAAAEQGFCASLIGANFSAILALQGRRLPTFDVCVNLSHCTRPAGPREDPSSGFQIRRPPRAYGVLSQVRSILANEAADAKEAGEELLARAVKASKKAVDDGTELVEKLGKSKEWKTLKKDARRAVGQAVER
jgi:hypothetical protein